MIDQLHAIINFANDKGLTGYHSSEDIDNEIHAVSTQLWMGFWNEYAKTQKLNDYMAPFEVKEKLTPAADSDNDLISKVEMEEIIEHPTLVEVVASGTTVEIVERAFWAKHKSDPVAPPTADFPVCLFASRNSGGFFTIEVMPKDLGEIRVYGLRKPVKVVWGFTIATSGRRTYNASESTELEWSELLFGTIRDQLLNKMEINLRENYNYKEIPLKT